MLSSGFASEQAGMHSFFFFFFLNHAVIWKLSISAYGAAHPVFMLCCFQAIGCSLLSVRKQWNDLLLFLFRHRTP